MKVAKWGNSLGIRIPQPVAKTLDLKEGDDIEVTVIDPRKIAIQKNPSTEELLDKIRSVRGKVPLGFKFNRDEANER